MTLVTCAGTARSGRGGARDLTKGQGAERWSLDRIGATMRRACTLILLLALSMAPATARQRGEAPAPTTPPIFEVHEQSIPELQAAQTEGRVTSRGLVGR